MHVECAVVGEHNISGLCIRLAMVETRVWVQLIGSPLRAAISVELIRTVPRMTGGT